MSSGRLPENDPSIPTSARAYGYLLGGKDNYAADREFVLGALEHFPQGVDIARDNRMFLYRVVRFLVTPVAEGGGGISQFLDFGCGLPLYENVHQVAQRFDRAARVVYVDNDPVVLTHGRALLANNQQTAVLQADFRDPETVLDDPATRRLIDFTEPIAILYLSVGHHLRDADLGEGHGSPRHALRHVIDEIAVPGSYLAVSQVVCDDPERGGQVDKHFNAAGLPWQTRTPAQLDALMDGLRPVEPGMVPLKRWRPDPGQPALPPPDPPLVPYIGATERDPGLYEYGGVQRKP